MIGLKTWHKTKELQRSAKVFGTWLREVCSCSCLPALLAPAWVLLSKICIPFCRSLYFFPASNSQFGPEIRASGEAELTETTNVAWDERHDINWEERNWGTSLTTETETAFACDAEEWMNEKKERSRGACPACAHSLTRNQLTHSLKRQPYLDMPSKKVIFWNTIRDFFLRIWCQNG